MVSLRKLFHLVFLNQLPNDPSGGHLSLEPPCNSIFPSSCTLRLRSVFWTYGRKRNTTKCVSSHLYPRSPILSSSSLGYLFLVVCRIDCNWKLWPPKRNYKIRSKKKYVKLDTYSNLGQKYQTKDFKWQIWTILQIFTWLELKRHHGFLPAFQRKLYNAVYLPSLT